MSGKELCALRLSCLASRVRLGVGINLAGLLMKLVVRDIEIQVLVV